MAHASHCYRAYGLWITSDEEIPELSRALPPAEPDVSYHLSTGPLAEPQESAWYHDSQDGDDIVWRRLARTPGGFLIRFTNLADFTLDAKGSRIAAFPRGATPEQLRHQLLDHVLPLALDLRGSRGLHATAVDTPHGVVAFLGPSGAGKSTLAARFVSRGHLLVADDCLVVRVQGNEVLTTPGYPGLRLHGDSYRTLFDSPGDEEATHMKRRVATEVLDDEPRRLMKIVLLDGRSTAAEPRLSPLDQASALLAMLSQSFVVEPLSPASIQAQITFFAAIASRVPAARLSAPRDLSRLSEIEALILDSLAR